MKNGTEYSFEFKLEIVLKIKLNQDSLRSLCRRHHLHRPTVSQWLYQYNYHGENGLKWLKSSPKSMEEKLRLVLLYRQSGLSLTQASAKLKITSPTSLSKWEKELVKKSMIIESTVTIENITTSDVSNKTDELYAEASIQCKPQDKTKELLSKGQFPSDKKLLDEIEFLKAELAYLKKLKALILKQALQKISQQ